MLLCFRLLSNTGIFADSLSKLPPAAPGSLALCKTKNGQIIAKGFYDPKSPLAFKSLALGCTRMQQLKPSNIMHVRICKPSAPLTSLRVPIGIKLALNISPLPFMAQYRLHRSWNMRMQLFDRASTNAYRLFNGEGDGLPGLVCDVYNDTAVFKLDGAGAEGEDS
eukprot:1158239-Pelagomonas_calceolata.AAC.6